jgi:outer membrane protein assembly factor BamD (BamD/ComL family)
LLEEARYRFPSGVIPQEREALAIEALVQLGQHAEAALRAAQFERSYPNSPHAARVRALVARH